MARLILMTDFTESYANQLLRGIIRYSLEHEPWVVCKMPLSLRDNGRMDEVLKFALTWKADAIIGQFRTGDDVSQFGREGIIAIAQDYEQKFPGLCNISGDYAASGRICADYFIRKGARNFGFYGLRGMVWSDERRDAFVDEIRNRVPNNTISIQESLNLSETWWYDLDQLTEWLRSLPKPVAILACDDNRAYYLVEACRKGGKGMRIPDDIMVLGIDNDEALCQLSSPQLSSLNQNVEEAGYNTAATIERLLALKPEERKEHVSDIIVAPTFITTRKSTDVFLHDNPHISNVLSYINSNLSRRISVEEIVAQVPMSRRLLEHLFRDAVGMSIYQYILKVRTEKMAELILHGTSPARAAAELDTDYKIIARNFKRANGMTPYEYARLAAEKKELQ